MSYTPLAGVRTPSEIIELLIGSIPPLDMPEVTEGLGVSLAMLIEVVESPETVRKRDPRASALAQACLERLAQVWQRAIRVFEDGNAVRIWLCQKNRALGGLTPLSLLGSDSGCTLVMQTLGRIACGIVS